MYFLQKCTSAHVVECWTSDRDVVGLNLAQTQLAIIPGTINQYHESWGVNEHATWCINNIHGVAALAGVQLSANKTEISAALWDHETQEELYFILLTYFLKNVQNSPIWTRLFYDIKDPS